MQAAEKSTLTALLREIQIFAYLEIRVGLEFSLCLVSALF
jgi:hypothetical protein